MGKSRKRLWLGGCLVFIIGLPLLANYALESVMRRAMRRAEASADQIYNLAMKRQLSKFEGDSIRKLRRLEKDIGQIESYQRFSSLAQVFGKPAIVYAEVTRNGKQYISETCFYGHTEPAYLTEYPISEWNGNQPEERRRPLKHSLGK